MKLRAWAAPALALMFALLLWRLSVFLGFAAHALSFPFGLDYGEGIVWQQALLMFTHEAYGRIDGFPAIVFHYPPFFHVVTRVVAALAGADILYSGRAVSILSTLLTALIVGLIVARAAPAQTSRAERFIAGSAAALALLCPLPVSYWAPMMRVDMLAIALSFAGFWLGLKAFERNAWIVPAALCFVAAVYTKQTSIAAPLALFGLMLWLRPRLALVGIGVCVTAGLVILGALTALTDGGFLRHVFLYNINRVDWTRVQIIVWMAKVHAGFIGVALLIGWGRLSDLITAMGGLNDAQRRTAIAADRGMTTYLAILAYMLATLPTLLLVVKVGSDMNYVLEWLFTITLLVGVALYDSARIVTGGGRGESASIWRAVAVVVLPLVVAVQAWTSAVSRSHLFNRQWLAELARLTVLVRTVRRPVISDDMALLVRAGKRVMWEPAIFAELASGGMWDESSLVSRIRRREFAMFITDGERGRRVFDSRYRPAIADAIDAAYPLKRNLAGYTLHLPPEIARTK